MRNFIAAVYYVLALFSCDPGGSTIVNRATIDGSDVLHSRTRMYTDVAKFECVRSASGQCHYTLFSRTCVNATMPATACTQPLDRFALQAGQSRKVRGLQPFELCVSGSGEAMRPGCKPDAPMAAR